MNNIKRIEEKLRSSLDIQYLELIDDSQSHANHYEKEDSVLVSHLTIMIWAKQFENITLVKQHRLINDTIKDEF